MHNLNKLTEVYKDDNKIYDSVEKRFQNIMKDGREVRVHTDSLNFDLPSFYDPERFRLGQEAFYNNVFAIMIAKLSGLTALLAVPSIVDVIKFTKQSNTVCSAYRRYVSTILHVFTWYKKEPNKQNEVVESLKIIRRKHCIAFRRSYEAGICRASQSDMAYTQFAFIGFSLLATEQLGINTTAEEMDGFIHFWRVIGYILGMEEKYNLCLETVEETRALCSKILDEVFLPSMINFKENFDEMGHVVITALSFVIPYLEPHAFKAFTLHLSLSLTTNNNRNIEIDYYDALPLRSKFIFNMHIYVLRYLISTKYWWSTIFRIIFNRLILLSVFCCEFFPILGYWAFGIKQSQVDIFRYNVYK